MERMLFRSGGVNPLGGKKPRLRALSRACCGSQARTQRSVCPLGSTTTWLRKPEADPVATHSPPVRTLIVAWLWKQHFSALRNGLLLGSGAVTHRLVVAAGTLASTLGSV